VCVRGGPIFSVRWHKGAWRRGHVAHEQCAIGREPGERGRLGAPWWGAGARGLHEGSTAKRKRSRGGHKGGRGASPLPFPAPPPAPVRPRLALSKTHHGRHPGADEGRRGRDGPAGRQAGGLKGGEVRELVLCERFSPLSFHPRFAPRARGWLGPCRTVQGSESDGACNGRWWVGAVAEGRGVGGHGGGSSSGGGR